MMTITSNVYEEKCRKCKVMDALKRIVGIKEAKDAEN
jgi:hypothetical protein